MNNDKSSKKRNHSTVEIENLKITITKKDIRRYASELGCDPKHVMLFKREHYPLISDHEIISSHFLEDPLLDRHLDRLDLGCRDMVVGHSKWLFPRNKSSNIAKEKGLAEMYFCENFNHFFKYVVDVDTEAVFETAEFTTQRREDLLYKPPLQSEAMVYVSDILEVTKYLCIGMKNPVVKLIKGAGFLDDFLILQNPTNNSDVYKGIYTTTKPHLMVVVKEEGSKSASSIVLFETETMRVLGVYSNSYQPDRRNFFLVIPAEDEDFRNRNDTIAE
ncbi:hypothetical protein ABEH28_13285 [Pseudomonas sp. Ps21-P2]|uniref:hypothetical protein n=1 Tax=Pseudomonas sp. Ps21-P2 TaxID=3080331 RepID=UPI003209E6E2